MESTIPKVNNNINNKEDNSYDNNNYSKRFSNLNYWPEKNKINLNSCGYNESYFNSIDIFNNINNNERNKINRKKSFLFHNNPYYSTKE